MTRPPRTTGRPGRPPSLRWRARCCPDGDRAVEFAIGTGRVAIPLREAGVDVTGIELSQAMLARLRQKVTAEQLPVVAGDMTTASAGDGFSLAYLVFNTIGNLLSQEQQVACFRNAAHHLAPGGCFVIELGVPQLRSLPPGPHPAALHLARRARPDGPAGRLPARIPLGRLVPHRVHRRIPQPRQRVPAPLTAITLWR